MKKTNYLVGDVLRLQLSQDGHGSRWRARYDTGLGISLWQLDDHGQGAWADALVVATTYEQEGYTGWPAEPMMILDCGGIRIDLPIEGHPAYPLDVNSVAGYPRPRRLGGVTITPAKCECGVDKVGVGLHSHWCPKAIAQV